MKNFVIKMSFFLAYPTPLMKVLIDSTTKMAENDLIPSLSMLADTCTKTLIDLMGMESLKEDIGNGFDHNSLLLLCTMTGCIILIDHLDAPNGVFHSKSPVLIKPAVETLVTYSNEYIAKAFLLNSMRFTTVHLNDEQTLSSVKEALIPQ